MPKFRMGHLYKTDILHFEVALFALKNLVEKVHVHGFGLLLISPKPHRKASLNFLRYFCGIKAAV